MTSTADIIQFPAKGKHAYTLITDAKRAEAIVKHVFNSGLTHALDIETTALHPAAPGAKISLIQMHGPTGTFIIDCLDWEYQGTIIKMLQCAEFAVFNAKFEGLWLRPHKRLICTGMLYRAMHGGNAWSLAMTVEKVLGVIMNKDIDHEQWAQRPLTKEQLAYAADDAIQTYDLYTQLSGQMTTDHWNGFAYINNVYNPVIEIEQTGIKLDREGHVELVQEWQVKADAALHTLRELVPMAEIPNVNSRQQVSKFLRSVLPPDAEIRWPRTRKTGTLSLTRSSIQMVMGYMWPEMREFLMAYLEYSRYQKYISSFGPSLADKCILGGIIKSQYHAARAITSRFSCSQPNLQQIPKDGSVRKLFRARPNKRLIAADYSSIEVKVAALISGDKQLEHDSIYGDVHQEMADLTGLTRSGSKAVTFGILYGSAAAGLAGRMGISHGEGQELINKWANRYPDAFQYRFRALAEARSTGYLTMPSGRQIFMGYRRPSLSKCANYPIQSTAADILNGALFMLWQQLDELRSRDDIHCRHTRIVATVHDEIIVETLPRDADAIEALVVDAMERGYLKVFPGADTTNLVDSGIGDSWQSAKP